MENSYQIGWRARGGGIHMSKNENSQFSRTCRKICSAPCACSWCHENLSVTAKEFIGHVHLYDAEGRKVVRFTLAGLEVECEEEGGDHGAD